MKKTRSARRMQKMLIMVAALTLVLGVAIGGTVAYLVATTAQVQNTFTVGKIEIDLDEAPVVDNKETTGDRVKANAYKVIPGDVIDKDPTVTVKSGSEKCYVFVLVTNSVAVNKDGDTGADLATPLNVASWTANAAWSPIATKTAADGTVKTLYVYGTADAGTEVDATATEKVLAPVFEEVTISNAVTEKNIETITTADKILVDAYAHQSENVQFATVKTTAINFFGMN